jgi:hypothetical protein
LYGRVYTSTEYVVNVLELVKVVLRSVCVQVGGPQDLLLHLRAHPDSVLNVGESVLDLREVLVVVLVVVHLIMKASNGSR